MHDRSTGPSDYINDLNFYKSLVAFQHIHKGAAEESLRKFKLHTWYLTPEKVVMCLFSDKLSDDVKNTVALKLLKYNIPKEYPKGKPMLVTITEKTNL